VALHYNDDLGLQEIADRLDLSESAVRSRLHRARSRLRALLEPAAAAA
jgi:RNA polymerase sigma-70 factor (ECF subfamily)